MKKLRRITEAEVIAEFLKNEFYEKDFNHDRERFRGVVTQADVTNEGENAIRRALLFRRRGHMMRELPADTQWWEMTLEPGDLSRVRVFPRAQWRRVAGSSFYVNDIVNRIRSGGIGPNDQAFAAKLEALSESVREQAESNSTVMLIGVDETQPMLILEGNHRLTAALLVSDELARTRFRVVCGLSPRMRENCWYDTNLPNLWRYAKNRFRHLVDKEANIERVLATIGFDPAVKAPAGLTQHATPESK